MLILGHEATNFRGNKQRGSSLLLFVVGLLLAAATIFSLKLLSPAQRGARQAEATAANFEAIQSAIFAYVTVNGRLPCPANPTAVNDGAADPATATTTCNSSNGVVPWATLGIAPEVALDGWNRRISFRVFEGPTGLTQTGGASMVNCDTKIPYGADQLDPGNLCNAAHTNLDTQFLNNKGAGVDNSGTLVSQVAFTLISHGESGYGAYMPGGGRVQMPSNPGSEFTNTGSVGPFFTKAHSAPGTDPSLSAHFDDVVAWVTISDLAKKSGLRARDWADPTPPGITVATTTNMNTAGSGHFNASTAGGGQTFTAATTTSEGLPVTTLAFGGGAGFYSNCAWWPTSFRIYNGADRFTVRAYLEFSTSSASTDLGGFTVGFMSKAITDAYTTTSGNLLTGLCGDTTVSNTLGWGNGVAVPLLGNLQSPRFAVEFDAFPDSVANNDPASNHLAIDFNDVVHGVSAATCIGALYHNNGVNDDCYTGSSNTWLRDGLSNFHRMRIEVVPRDPACSAGGAPRLKVWVLPQSVCPDGATATICTSAKDISQAFVPTLPLPAGVVSIESCISLPSPSTAFDEIYFGFTASNLPSPTGPLLDIRNLDASAYFTP